MQGLFFTAEASKTIAAALVGSRLDFCNPLVTSVSNLTFSLSKIVLLGWSHKNLGSATSNLFYLICIGFRFATELALKSLRLLPGCYSFSRHLISHLSFHDMYRREPSALFYFCQYVFPHVKPPWQSPNHFRLMLQVSRMHCQIICHPCQFFEFLSAFRRALKHHLFLLAYPD